MGHVRVRRSTRARLGWWAGWAAALTGLYLLAGIAPTLLVGGLVVAGSFLLLYEVDERSAGEPAAGGPPSL